MFKAMQIISYLWRKKKYLILPVILVLILLCLAIYLNLSSPMATSFIYTN